MKLGNFQRNEEQHMKNLVTKSLGAALLSVCVGTVTAAPLPADDVSELVGTGIQTTQLTTLSETTMRETRGEFLQLMGFVLGVAAVDLAVASLMWGSYIESAETAGEVSSDDIIIQNSGGAEQIVGMGSHMPGMPDEVKLHSDFTDWYGDAATCDFYCASHLGM